MLVIEGQLVDQDEPIATLIDTDAKLALAQARAMHTLQEAEVGRAKAALVAARTNLAKPVSLQASLADAGALLAETQLAIGNLPYALQTAKTKQKLAAESVRRKELAGGAIAGRILREARAELATATNAVNELAAREPTLQRQLESLQQKRDALAEQLSLLTAETHAVAEAEANLTVAKAQAEQTKLAVKAAELRLERMKVRSPITGRVLSLEARPGQSLAGINPHSAQGSSAVVSLYDPTSLQIRVDVRLEDVPQVQIGQPALIETAALPAPIDGKVTSVTTLADIQKNTLQVKVAVTKPPEVIKPEMLAKVTFLAPPSTVVEEDEGKSPLRLFVPQSLVTTGDGGAIVWVVDLTAGIAQRKAVEVGRGATQGGLVEVTSGLQPTDKLIVTGRESVAEGTRVRVTGEDRTISSGSRKSRGDSQPASRTAQAPESSS
jgi:RND family efflux transporter MFP subunit